MSELPLIAVTDSATCPRPLAEQIERLAKLTKLRPQAVILRAKSLDKPIARSRCKHNKAAKLQAYRLFCTVIGSWQVNLA